MLVLREKKDMSRQERRLGAPDHIGNAELDSFETSLDGLTNATKIHPQERKKNQSESWKNVKMWNYQSYKLLPSKSSIFRKKQNEKKNEPFYKKNYGREY